MQKIVLSQIINELLYTLRNPETKPFDFRGHLEKLGEYLALQVLEELSTKETSIQTITGYSLSYPKITESPVLTTILRAGLPLCRGMERVFPHSEIGFFAMSRNEETLKAKMEYIALPDLKDRTVILSDVMLATGGSIIDAINVIQRLQPKKIFIICAIATPEGLASVLKHHPLTQIYSASVDLALNDKGFIIPGLGDAGDRCFGKKYRF